MPVCGVSLEGRRADARYCSDACRAEAWGLRRLDEGRAVGRYTCLAERMAAYGRARRSTVHKKRERPPNERWSALWATSRRLGKALPRPRLRAHKKRGP